MTNLKSLLGAAAFTVAMGVGLGGPFVFAAVYPGAAHAARIQPESQAAAVDFEKVEAKRTKSHRYIMAKDAIDLIKNGKNGGRVFLIDVRTAEEWQFVGHAEGAVLIPAFKIDTAKVNETKHQFAAALDPTFIDRFTRFVFENDVKETDTILVMCRSGDRSAMAANQIFDGRFANVISVYDGFEGDLSKDGRRDVNGWKNAGGAWGYSVDPKQLSYVK